MKILSDYYGDRLLVVLVVGDNAYVVTIADCEISQSQNMKILKGNDKGDNDNWWLC